MTQDELITADFMRQGQTLPLLLQPKFDTVDLAAWAADNRVFIESNLLKHGALLFRGFNIATVSEFERSASATCPELFGEYGDLPREKIGGKVYGSTPYPADQSIWFHNESSHMHRWPMKIWFYCIKAASEGGETPIVDCRAMYRRIDREIRRRFSERKLMYVRNYVEGLDVSWQTFFGMTQKSEVEAYCPSAGVKFEWKDDGSLRTRQISPAVAKHPTTGEMVWFNQVQLHHPSCLEAGLREALLAVLKPEDLPRNVMYGDGAPIEDSVIEQIGEAYRETAVSFPWREGDILMLNNMLVAHARNPYFGPRKIVVAMAEMMNQAALSEPERLGDSR